MTAAIATAGTPRRGLRVLAFAAAATVALALLLVALDAWWPWFHANRWSVAQQAIIGLTNGLIIALVALGYTMVYGIIELINFAHGDLVMLGAFLALTLIGACGLEAHPVLGLGLLLVATPVFCATLNWGVERLAYRPIREAPKLTALVTAIGVSFVFMNLGLFWGGAPLAVFDGGHAASAAKSVPDLVSSDNLCDPRFSSHYRILSLLHAMANGLPILITLKDVLVVIVTIPLMVALTAFVKYTRLGTAMRATAQNPTAARLMGIDVDRVIGATFVIGGALGGIAAVVYALYNNSIGFQMGYRIGMDAFTAAVLGGIGNLPGAVLGGLVIGLVRASCDGFFSSEWTNAVVFGALILTLVFRPSGLLGAHVREKV